MRTPLPAILPLAAALAVSPATPAAAADPQIDRFDFSVPVSDSAAADCRPGVTATFSGVERIAGQRVTLGPDNFRLHGVITDAVDVAFSDGSIGFFSGTERFSAEIIGDLTIRTVVHRDTTPVYSAGRLIGTASFRVVEHFALDDGTVRVDFAHPVLTCDF